MLATRTTLSHFLPRIRCRTFAHSCARWNTAADVHRSKEVGAAAETQDVTAMDALLKATRAKASPSNQRLIPVRSRGKWQDTLRLRLSPSSSSSPSPPPSSTTPTPPALEPRHMSTSYTETILPFHSSSDLLEAYTNTSGGIRTGMLMEHLDNIAGSIAYKYMLGDEGGEGGRSVSELGYYIVTASVDRLDMLAPLYPVRDLRLSGQVIHVGRSSMEIVVRMEALEPGHTNEDAQGKTVMLGRFCMVCRDSKTHKARAVNPLVIESEEDRRLNAIGEAHKNRRHRHAIQSLARVPPSSEEAAALHALYLQSTSPSPSSSSTESDEKKIERVKMEDTRVEKTLTMYPQERNVHQKIFGGYLMRLAYELGYTNSMLFTRGPVRFLSLDSIAFAKPVPIGSVLHLTSHILHTVGTERYPTLIHVGVKATVIDIKTGLEELTNDFRFTWCKEEGEPVPRTVVPMTYQEAMWWIEGKRALDLGAEIRGIRQRQRQW
ncbi:HotDog domain-containing protein [Irpex lacteus]|nr:HotDog domain-containing protein [Irpex lacteus]